MLGRNTTQRGGHASSGRAGAPFALLYVLFALGCTEPPVASPPASAPVPPSIPQAPPPPPPLSPDRAPDVQAAHRGVEWLLGQYDHMALSWRATSFVRIWRRLDEPLAARVALKVRAAEAQVLGSLATPLPADARRGDVMNRLYQLAVAQRAGRLPTAAVAPIAALCRARPADCWDVANPGVKLVALSFAERAGIRLGPGYDAYVQTLRQAGYGGDPAALTHVILLDSDYGARHLPAADYAVEAALVPSELTRLLARPVTLTTLDLIGELLVAASILGLPESPETRRARALIRGEQNADGSWAPDGAGVDSRALHHTGMLTLALLPMPPSPRQGVSVF